MHFTYVNFTLKEKKINKYWTVVHDVHTGVFRGECTDVCNLFWNAAKQQKKVDTWIEGWIRSHAEVHHGLEFGGRGILQPWQVTSQMRRGHYGRTRAEERVRGWKKGRSPEESGEGNQFKFAKREKTKPWERSKQVKWVFQEGAGCRNRRPPYPFISWIY